MLRHDPIPASTPKGIVRIRVAGTVLAWLGKLSLREAAVGTVTEFKALRNEGPATYTNGVADGKSARAEGSALTLYLQVGIDDYAKGFRAGFFGQTNPARTVDKR